jgi:hypothetical protein
MRTAGDMPTASSNRWPPAGWCPCVCYRAEKWKSPNKGTPAVKVFLRSLDGEYEFDDPVFVTTKAMARLNLVAQHLAAMPKTTQLPDDDAKCAGFFAQWILAHAQGHRANVLIETSVEEFIYETGPKTGQKGSVTRHRVAFAGYDPLVDEPASHDPPQTSNDFPPPVGDDIPF